MSESVVVARKSPCKVALKRGEKYFWCSCGRSARQPFCDGSHKGSGLLPMVFTAEKDGDAWLCGCKRTGGRPFCDGTHNRL